MLRAPDAFFGDLYALDALEAEEQFDEVRRWLSGGPLDDCPERLLHVLTKGDAVDREAAQVHLHALIRLKHAQAFVEQPGRGTAPQGIRHWGAGAVDSASCVIPYSRLDDATSACSKQPTASRFAERARARWPASRR